MTEVDVLAIYLPQFHPIPENDEAWGKGFTEWTNVARAKPLFHSHNQPRIPADLGFYDLRLEETRVAQAELAQRYGVTGFCYYHYWFAGRRLLDTPISRVIASGKPSFPFCLFWANETWSRRWLGEEREIILKQTYSEIDDYQHAEYLARVFSDPRYFRILGRPVFLIYRPHHLPNPSATIDIIKRTALRRGLPEPYFIGNNAHRQKACFRQQGFDASLSFEPALSVIPQHMTDGPGIRRLARNIRHGHFSSRLKLYDYNAAKTRMEAISAGDQAYPCSFVGWDNTPRRGNNGIVILNQDPERFEQSLRRARAIAVSKALDAPVIFINAWNEWAEGNYLEPDLSMGHAYLERVAAVFPERATGFESRAR